MKASELARLSGTNGRTLRRMTERGQVPCVREKTKGGHYRYADCALLRNWAADLLAKKVEKQASFDSAPLPEKISIFFRRGKADVRKMRLAAIKLVNSARATGIHLQTLCDRKRMTFSLWQKHCEGKLPFDFESAKLLVSVARRMPAKAKTFADAAPFFRTLQHDVERYRKLVAEKPPVTPLSTK
jgi:hypothetical protein